jgi:hypothetical protein
MPTSGKTLHTRCVGEKSPRASRFADVLMRRLQRIGYGDVWYPG